MAMNKEIDISKFKDQNTALVLSGGVVKAAAWHIGVTLALDELGFSFKSNKSTPSPYEISTYVGSSAGSFICSYLASGHHPMELVSSFVDGKGKITPLTYKDMLSVKHPYKYSTNKKSKYDSFESFPFIFRKLLNPLINRPGLFSTVGLAKYLKKNILSSSDFNKYDANLYVIATALDHSRKVIFSKHEYESPKHDPTAEYYTGFAVEDAIAASMSVPPFYSPYPMKNSYTGNTDFFFDGEIRDTLSTHVAVDNGCKQIISSWTHTPYHFHKEVGSLAQHGLPAICTQAIYLMIQKKILSARARRNSAQDLLDTVHEYMNDQKFSKTDITNLTAILEKKLDFKKDVNFIDIFPKPENYRVFFKNSFSLNPNKMSDLVTLGYKKTLEVLKDQSSLQ